MYCPGSRCRVYAHRRRKLTGQKPPARKPVYTEGLWSEGKTDSSMQFLAELQRKRKKAKLPELVRDGHLQAAVDEEACRIMSKRVRALEDDAAKRSYKCWRGDYYIDKGPEVLKDTAHVKINPKTTHIGLRIISPELGGGVVIQTARRFW